MQNTELSALPTQKKSRDFFLVLTPQEDAVFFHYYFFLYAISADAGALSNKGMAYISSSTVENVPRSSFTHCIDVSARLCEDLE